MEIIDREDDEYKWLDAEDRTEASFAHRNKVKMITFLEGTWIIKVNHDFDGSDTLLVYYTTNDFLNVEDLGVLFEIAQNQKIRRIIFNKFIFRSRLCETGFAKGVQELVFNECYIGQRKIGNILEDLDKHESFDLRRLVIRNSNDITQDIRSINLNISYKYHKLRSIRLINCKIKRRYLDTVFDGAITIVTDFTSESEYTKESNDDFKAELKITKKYIDNNNSGYRKCQQLCLALISLKRNKLSPLFTKLDPDVLIVLVKMIWKTRYQNIWYKDVDPYGNSSEEESE